MSYLVLNRHSLSVGAAPGRTADCWENGKKIFLVFLILILCFLFA